MSVIQGPEHWKELKQPNILFHEDAERELEELMKVSSFHKKIYSLLCTRIAQLSEFRESVFKINEFKRLKDAQGLCAMHIKVNDANIRILFSITQNGDYILHAFFKREGKKATDYNSHIPIAIARKSEMEVIQNEQEKHKC